MQRTNEHRLQRVFNTMHANVLASSKRSGSSLESFSRATSAMGPNITTGLRNPAAHKVRRVRAQLQSNLLAPLGHGQTPHPLSAQLFHTQGTLSGPAGRTGPLCSSSGSSWNCGARGTSRSRPDRPLPFWGECIARWRAAPLCLHVAERQRRLLMSHKWMCHKVGTAQLDTAKTQGHYMATILGTRRHVALGEPVTCFYSG